MDIPGGLEIEKKQLGDIVAEKLRRRIILGEIPAGEHLKENALAEEFGVSRGPIRQAIAQLSMEGLVTIPKNGRSQVNGFSVKAMEDLYYVRILLETSAVLCIENPRDAGFVERLNELIRRMNRPGLTLEEFNRLDMLFHYSIIAESRNRTLIQSWLGLKGPIETLLEITNHHIKYGGFDGHTIESLHDVVKDALVAGDKEKAAELIELQLSHGVAAMRSILLNLQMNGQA